MVMLTGRASGSRVGVSKPAGKEQQAHLHKRHMTKKAIRKAKTVKLRAQHGGSATNGGKRKRFNPNIGDMRRVQAANNNKKQAAHEAELLEFAQQYFWRRADMFREEREVRQMRVHMEARDRESQHLNDQSRQLDRDSRQREKDSRRRDDESRLREAKSRQRARDLDAQAKSNASDKKYNDAVYARQKTAAGLVNKWRTQLKETEESQVKTAEKHKEEKEELQKEKEAVLSIRSKVHAFNTGC